MSVGRCRNSDFSGGGRQFLAAHVAASFIRADELTAVPLRDLLLKERPAALGARLRDRFVPERELALGIICATVENFPATRLAFDDVAAVERADDARLLELHVLALGISGARRELAETALLHDEVLAAVRAELVENLIGLRRGHALLRRDDLPRRLALRITGAGQEHSEAPALDDHRLAAVLTRFVQLF